jgi:hypothetical protein
LFFSPLRIFLNIHTSGNTSHEIATSAAFVAAFLARHRLRGHLKINPELQRDALEALSFPDR